MVSRITGQMMLGTAQRNLQSSLSALSALQNKGTSQKAITKPSDDPAATASAISVRAQQRATTQYGRNIDDGLGWLATADSTLSASTATLQQVRDLVVQGANSGATSASGREAIATQLLSLKDELRGQANTTYLGRSIFAGSSDAPAAFASDYSYKGASSATVERRIDPATTVQVDVDGAAVYGSGATSTFAMIDSIVNDLRAGTNIGGYISKVDDSLGAVSTQQSAVGARYARLESAKSTNAADATSLESKRSSVEDVDIAEVILQLQTQQTSYQTALSVTARALQPSLMSFLS